MLALAVLLHIVAYVEHRGAVNMEPLLTAPSWLSLLCGRPLPDNRLSVFPMLFQINTFLLIALELALVLVGGRNLSIARLRLVAIACLMVGFLARALYTFSKEHRS